MGVVEAVAAYFSSSCKMMNVESVVDELANDIRSEDSIHGPVVKDLAKLAASSAVTEEDFHATFLKALGR